MPSVQAGWNLATSSPWTFIIIFAAVIGILVGNIEMVKVVFRRSEQVRRQQLAAIDFALANFDLLKDQRQDILTRGSLLLAKTKVSEADRQHVDILLDKIDVFGHVVPKDRSTPGTESDFGISRNDLNRVKHNI
jgi:hypothetical protein